MVTIIMPIYNEAKYIEESVASVLKQSYTDFELICVDDSSTDGTSDILERLCASDSRIRLIRNESNVGAGEARNIGLRAAKGKYIAMFDGDDVFDKDIISCAVNAMEKYDADLVFWDCIRLQSDDIGKKVEVYHSPSYIDKFCGHVFDIGICNLIEFYYLFASDPWNKLYRSDFIKKNNLWFYQLPWNDDVLFCELATILSKKMIRINTNKIMVYGRNHDSKTRQSNNQNPWCSYKVMLKWAQEMQERRLWETRYRYFFLRLYKRMSASVRVSARSPEEQKRFLEFMQAEGFDHILSYAGIFLEKADPIVRKLLYEFMETSFETGWYQEDHFIKYCYRQWLDEAVAFIREEQTHDARVALWGIGLHATHLLEHLQANGIFLDALIDKDSKKHGESLYGQTIVHSDDVLPDIETILFISPWIYREKYSDLERMGKRTVNLLDKCPTAEYALGNNFKMLEESIYDV